MRSALILIMLACVAAAGCSVAAEPPLTAPATVAKPTATEPWLTYEGTTGPGTGKHIVLIAADQEYRSEQSLPMLAAILARHHGFTCTVLFSVNQNGEVDPTLPIRWDQEGATHNIPGLAQLADADLMILFSRLITLPEEQLAHITDYLDSGKPIIGIRTANHGFIGFNYEVDGRSVNFGEDVLGGAFREHHGNWHADSTRGIIAPGAETHPVLRGVKDVWGPSDVYRTFAKDAALPESCTPLLLGQPLLGRAHDDAPNPKKIPLPVAWTRTFTGNGGTPARVFHTTMGSAKDYQCADLRRLTVNAAYWCLGLEDAIDPTSSVAYVRPYTPLPSGFNYEKLGVVPRPVSACR